MSTKMMISDLYANKQNYKSKIFPLGRYATIYDEPQ